MALEFKEFHKIPRLKRGIVVTEKIDGTNAQVHIRPVEGDEYGQESSDKVQEWGESKYFIRAGSRNRWIVPGDDNFGFAKWVWDNSTDLVQLGLGSHFGEWWGSGIQRRYGLEEKRFSLFNVARWNPENPNKPKCCHVVPILYQGPWTGTEAALNALKNFGSVAAPGFMNPEGIVIYHTASRSMFKQTIEKDDEPKSKQG